MRLEGDLKEWRDKEEPCTQQWADQGFYNDDDELYKIKTNRRSILEEAKVIFFIEFDRFDVIFHMQ